MMDFLNSKLIGLQLWMRQKGEEIKQEAEQEDGVSALVATVLLILIVVLLAVVFWDKISVFFDEQFDKINENANKLPG